MKLNKLQIIFIIGALALIVIIWFLPKTTTEKSSSKGAVDVTENVEDIDVASLKDSAFKKLSQREKDVIKTFDDLIQSASDSKQKANLYDSLGGVWAHLNYLPLAAINYEEAAKIIQSESSWMNAGDAYFNSFRYLKYNKDIYISSAIESYKKVLNINSDNIEAETSLAVCYVEGSAALGQPPMKGINMLLSVLEKDPNNLNALVNLGYFSIRSGQYDKAKERFKQVLKSHPDYSEAYIYLADLALNENDTLLAVKNLEKYKATVSDSAMLPQVDAYLQNLEQRN